MTKIKYYFNRESAQIERTEKPAFYSAFHIAIMIVLSITMAYGLNWASMAYLESSYKVQMDNEIRKMEFHYSQLNHKVESISNALSILENKSDFIYKIALGAGNSSLMHSSIDAKGCPLIRKENPIARNLIVELNEKVDKMERTLYLQSLSQDNVMTLYEIRERQYAAMPTIQPIANCELIAISSGFGSRIHPIFNVIRMHSGIDLAAAQGTPVFATANGQVVAIDEMCEGYGKIIMINHGFGYETHYAHLQDFLVTVGQQVKRGEQIGWVGNTGLSTAPHLHYEVLVNGEPIDPENYFFSNQSNEYVPVVEFASVLD